MTDRPLHVLHVIGGLELGGAETLLYRLATRPSTEVSHEVVCLGSRDWYSSRLEQQGIAVHHMEMNSAVSLPSGVAKLRKLIRASSADVIQSWMYLANVLSGLLGRQSGVPVVWGIHATSANRSSFVSRLCAYAGGAGSRWLADSVANCSQRSAEAHDRLGYSAVPNIVIPNGYDPSVFYPDDEQTVATRAALGLAPETFVIGSVSRWHPDKDIPSLLKAMSVLPERGIDAHCILIGRGLDPSNAGLVREIEQLGLKESTLLLGLREDVNEILRAIDLHILSSQNEAFPNVIAESMLSGVPNIATDVGDSAEMIGEAGWVVSPGDHRAIADAIGQANREWGEQSHHWRERRRAARERIAKHYTLDRMVQAYEQLWRNVAFND